MEVLRAPLTSLAPTIIYCSAVWRSSTACGYIQETRLTSATEPRPFAGASYDLTLSLYFDFVILRQAAIHEACEFSTIKL
jgi:hypothetical protein